jgi:hypothetical protein
MALSGRAQEAEALLLEHHDMFRLVARYWITRGRIALYRDDRETLRMLLLQAGNELTSARGEVLNFLAPLSGAGSVERACAAFAVAAQDADESPRRRVLFAQLSAELEAASGDRVSSHAAVTSVERAVTLGLNDRAWIEDCPPLAHLRSDARFRVAQRTVANRAEQILNALPVSPTRKHRSP